MSEEKIKDLQERKHRFNAEIKELRIRRTPLEYQKLTRFIREIIDQERYDRYWIGKNPRTKKAFNEIVHDVLLEDAAKKYGVTSIVLTRHTTTLRKAGIITHTRRSSTLPPDLSKEKIKDLQERKKQINAEIKRIRGDLSEYDGEVKFPIKYSLKARGYSTRRKKLTSFKHHNLPHTTLTLSWGWYYKDMKEDLRVSGSHSILAYLGNKLKPKSGSYLVEIKITPLEEEAEKHE